MQEQKRNKKLTISLLVSGRKETTERCLDSLSKLCTELDSELILVDTGCDDDLRQKLSGYTDHIIPFTWCDDFAAARNVGLKEAQGEWFLFLDDDEWFEDVTPVLDFFTSEESAEYDQAVYKVRNYSNYEGTSYSDDWVSRIIRLEEDTHFTGRIHEYLTPSRGKCKKLDAFVHHFGYVYTDEENKDQHFERNVIPLKLMIREDPGFMKWRIQLIQEYRSWEKPDEMRQVAQEALEYCKDEDQFYINQCRGVFYSAIILAAMMRKEYGEAAAKAARYLSDRRNSWDCKCNLCRYAVQSVINAKNYQLAIRFCAKYFEYYNEAVKNDSRSEQEQIIAESMIFVNQAVKQEVYYEMLLCWAESYAKNRTAGSSQGVFPKERQQEICDYTDQLIADRTYFLCLPEQIWEAGKAGLVNLEEKLLDVEFIRWKVVVSDLAEKEPAAVERVYRYLQEIQSRDDIRYDYFNMHYAVILILLEGIDENYEAINRRFYLFQEYVLKFYRRVYLDSAFQDDMEMLPSKCRAAVWLEKLYECREDDWEQKLSYLRKCAKENTGLGKTIKSFATLIGQEQERRLKAAEEASDELRQLAKQVKQKVEVMLANGMRTEALQVVRQLRGMIPEDKELEQLEIQIQSAG